MPIATRVEISSEQEPAACPDCGRESVRVRTVGPQVPRAGGRHDGQVGQWRLQRCAPCAEREDQRLADTAAAAKREHRIAMALAELNVPPLYASATLEGFSLHGEQADRDKQARAMQLARRYVAAWPDVPMITLFLGVPGSGKGHTAWSIVRTLAESHGAMSRVCVLSDVIRDLRDAWGDRESGSLSEAQRLARYRSVDLLVVDEVSRHSFYGQPQQHLYDLIAWREVQLKPTILTTNESGEQLAEFLGPALSSRVLGWGAPWDFGEDDFRLRRGSRVA